MNFLPFQLHKNQLDEVIGLSLITIVLISFLLFTLPIGFTLYGLLALNLLLIGIALTFYKPYYLILGYFLSTTIYLNNFTGLPPSEMFFFIITLLVIAFFIFPNLITQNIPFYTRIDWLALVFILLLGYGVILGYINGASFTDVLGDLNYYLGFITYFAFLYYFHKPAFRKVLLYLFGGIVLYILIRNAINYREIIVQAYAQWQVEKARVATNEVYILAGSSLFLTFYLYSKSWVQKITFLSLFIASIGGIIITQSRGYWLAFLFTHLVITSLAERKHKKDIFLIAFSTGIVTLLVFAIYFSDSLTLIYQGLSARIESIANLTQDMGESLKERYLEAKVILGKLLYNPIAGYGLGVSYDRYLLIPRTNFFKETSYIHNGYLAVWFKFGLMGLCVLLYYCFSIFRKGYTIFIYNSGWIKAIALSILGTLSGMLLVNNTSPQFFSYGSMLLLALMGVFTSYYSNQVANELEKKQNADSIDTK